MSWLRLDDGFTSNAKVGQLTDAEFRCWMRLLCHCAKAGSPNVGQVELREVATLTKARVSRFAEIGLLDSADCGYEVHDWVLYADVPVAEKVAYFLARNPDATANEVVRGVAAKRDIVLSEVKRQRGSESGSLEPVSAVPKVVHARVLPSRPLPTKNPEGLKHILGTWLENAPPLIRHRPSIIDSTKAQRAAKKAEAAYGIDDVTAAVRSYAHVLGSSTHYFTHSYTLPDFLTRGIHKFVPEARPLENFRNSPPAGRDRGASMADVFNILNEGGTDERRALPLPDVA